MADFQSFLFQNMQSIGLEDEETSFNETLKKNTSNLIDNSKTKNSNKLNENSNSNIKISKSSFSSSNLSNSSTSSSSKLKQISFADYILSDAKNSNKNFNNLNQNSNSNMKEINKVCSSISVSTTETFLSSNNINKDLNIINNSSFNLKSISSNSIEDDHYDLNNQVPNTKFLKTKIQRVVKHEDFISESTEQNKLPDNEVYVKKDQIFESNYISNDYIEVSKESMNNNNINLNNSCSVRDLSSPDSMIKFDFKSSTPIVKLNQLKVNELKFSKIHDYSQMSQDEREIKSPKPTNVKLFNQESFSNKFSPCKSIFDKKTMSKVSLTSFNEDESLSKNLRLYKKPIYDSEDDSLRLNTHKTDDNEDNSNYQVTSKIFNNRLNVKKKKFDDLVLNSDSDTELNKTNSSIESCVMEPYLNKFEEELIKNKKSEVIKDLTQLSSTHSITKKPKSPSSHNLFQKYFKEIKNITLKKTTNSNKEKKSILDINFENNNNNNLKQKNQPQQESEELIYMEKTEPIMSNKENLKNLSKTNIPWHNIDQKSADELLISVLDNLNQHVEELPILLSKKGNKISQNQVKRWHDMLEKLALDNNLTKSITHDSDVSSVLSNNNIITKSPGKISSKQFLMNKKKKLLDNISKKTSKTLHDISHGCNELTKSVSKLYANVVTDDKEKQEKHEKHEKNEKQDKHKESKLNQSIKSILNESSDHISINTQMEPEKIQEQMPKKPPKRPPVPKSPVLEDNSYVNENFFVKADKQKGQTTKKANKPDPNQINQDHFYNEINDIESKQNNNNTKNLTSQHRARGRERENADTKKPAKPQINQTEEQKPNPKSQKFENLKQLIDASENSLNTSQTNLVLKKNLQSITKLKSPERKILYKDWFSIIKRMEKDPNFDLEALVKTRGRFTEHEKISYRDKMMDKEKLRCARSEPNFGAFMYNQQHLAKNRGVNTAPASKISRKNFEPNPSQKNGIRRNFSDNGSATVGANKMSTSRTDNTTGQSKRNNSELDLKQQQQEKAEALKLTLEKKDINKIKEILKKKDKILKSDLTSLAANLKSQQHQRKKSSDIANRKQRISSQGIIDEEEEDEEQVEQKVRARSNRNRKMNNFSSESVPDMDEDNQSGKNRDNILLSKCKNMYNKSEAAKALCDEMSKIKGKIGSKLKNISQTSSKLVQKTIGEHKNGSQSPDIFRRNKMKSTNQDNMNKKKLQSQSAASISQGSEVFSQDESEAPKRPNRNHHHHQKKEVSNSRTNRNQSSNSNNKQITSSKASSPARPLPPKRPPPPRPFSPATSSSSYINNKKSAVKETRRRGQVHQEDEDEDERTQSETPPPVSKKSGNLPPRPPIPSQLPPRPPSSKQISKSRRGEEELTEVYELEEIKPRNHNQRNLRRNHVTETESRKKISSSSISSMSNSRSLTPQDHRSKNHNRKENSRR